MISVHVFFAGHVQAGGEELIEAWRCESQAMIWVDLFGNDPAEEAELLSRVFGLHKLAIQDAQRERHPPKIEAFDKFTFILLRGLSGGSQGLDFKTIQLALFVGDRFLVTRHSGPSRSVNQLEEKLAEAESVKQESAAKLVLRLCRLMANRYVGILLELEPRLEEIEEQMLEKPNDGMLAELITYKSDLKRLNRFANYHERVFRGLKDKSFPNFGNGERKHEIIDVWEQHERAQSLSQLYYETASDLIDGHISVASHRLNQIMKVLTIITAVFVPLSFLAGIYGMNFENMPELTSKSGYFILLAVMATIATSLLVIFRRMRWL